MKSQKTTIRKIGNSLGVLIPKSVLDERGLSEGDDLDVTLDGVMFPDVNFHQSLDDLRRKISLEILSRFKFDEIRKHSLSNLERWEKNDVWGPPYEEWRDIMLSKEDEYLVRMMVSMDDHPVQLRQSSPFVGLVPKDVLMELKRGLS